MIVDIGDGIAYAVCLREGGTAGKLQEAVETTDEKLPSQSGGKGIVSGKKAERFRQVCAQGGVGAKQPGQDEEGRAEFVRGRLIQAQEGSVPVTSSWNQIIRLTLSGKSPELCSSPGRTTKTSLPQRL